jgi:protease I
MADELSGKKVAILATDGVERVELEQPRSAVADAGAEVELLSIHDGEIVARNHDLEDAGTFTVDGLVSDASVGDYDALLLPGGTVNPDKLRMDQITSWPSLRTDLRNAGATVLDEEVVVDEGLVSSRSPDDLPAFCDKVVEEFAEGRHADRMERTAS